LEVAGAAARPPKKIRVIKKNIYAIKTRQGENFVAQKSDEKSPLSVVNLPFSLPKPPANLHDIGASLWRSIMSEYDIADSGGQVLLEQICHAYERAERLRVEIDRDGAIIRGRAGMREHPGLKAELASRSFVCRSLQRLGINLEVTRLSPGRPSQSWRNDANE
jgi:hypothetical protein